MKKIPTTLPGWAEGRVARDSESGCLLWTGTLFSTGYGMVRVSGKSLHVHRVMYESIHGRIPDGMQIDHVHDRGCRHRNCIEPDHLEAVTPQMNTQRYHDSLTHCRNGHPRSLAVARSDGKRRCPECRRNAHRRWVARNPEKYRQMKAENQARRRSAK